MQGFGFKISLGLIVLGFINPAFSLTILQNANYQSIGQGESELRLQFSEKAKSPTVFSIKNPNRLILDFEDAKNEMDLKSLNNIASHGIIREVSLVENNKKMRIVLSLEEAASIDTRMDGNEVVLSLLSQLKDVPKTVPMKEKKQATIESFDFKRGEKGEGRLLIKLSSSNTDIDVSEEGDKMVARFMGTQLPKKFQKNFNVLDFATPVSLIKMQQSGENAVFELSFDTSSVEKIAYQLDKTFVIEASIPQGELVETDTGVRLYNGERLSLNFQDIEVRAVLQVLADFSGFNLVTSDNVQGTITLRLQNVPWDQALDIILRTKGLEKRENGNVVLIGPAQDILESEKTELASEREREENIPLKSEIIQINYAVAADMATLLREQSSAASSDSVSTGVSSLTVSTSSSNSVPNGVLSSRGSVTVDDRTNSLLVQDTPKKLSQIRELIKKLDRPVSQVEIATQIVKATSNISDALGFRLGGASTVGIGHRRLGIGSNMAKARGIVSSSDAGKPVPSPSPVTAQAALGNSNATPTVLDTEGIFHALGTPISGAGTIGFALARLPAGTLLDLELQALETLSLTKVVSRPRLLTQDQTEATVTQGIEIPYTSTTGTGSESTALNTVEFKEAQLSFTVTPHITPDKRILMNIDLTNDERGETINGVPSIDTNELKTTVLSDNGETIVLGGVFKNTVSNSQNKVPYLGDIPFLGRLFRSKNKSLVNNEILIFVTPKIVSYE